MAPVYSTPKRRNFTATPRRILKSTVHKIKQNIVRHGRNFLSTSQYLLVLKHLNVSRQRNYDALQENRVDPTRICSSNSKIDPILFASTYIKTEMATSYSQNNLLQSTHCSPPTNVTKPHFSTPKINSCSNLVKVEAEDPLHNLSNQAIFGISPVNQLHNTSKLTPRDQNLVNNISRQYSLASINSASTTSAHGTSRSRDFLTTTSLVNSYCLRSKKQSKKPTTRATLLKVKLRSSKQQHRAYLPRKCKHLNRNK